MLQLRNIIKDFGGRRIFAGIDWHLRPGDKVGLCGENGAGKTTLLKMLAGQVSPDGGEIQSAKGTTFGYLPQDGLEYRGRSLFAEVRSALSDLLAMEAEIGRLEEAIAVRHDTDDLDRYATLQESFRQRGGYTLEAEIGKVLAGLGFAEVDWEKPCEHFSGGWQMRIALAKLLLQQPNLLLLDEPTNHLDLPARDWLEGYLSAYPHAVILVSHDRFFLDQVVGRIIEVWNASLTEYPGNYSRYIEERERRISALMEEKRRQDEEVAKIEAFISRFRYQANKASLVQSRVKQLEKIERIAVPPQRKKIAFRFPEPPKGARTALELHGATQSYGPLTVLAGVDLTVERGERLSLVGPNGAGKSTLMRLLAGVESPKGGQRVEGHNLVSAYFAQDQAKVLDPSRTVLEEITTAAPFDMVPRVRDILGSFLFSGDDVQKKVAVLSGGERNRLALAILLLRPANLLLLDEPTNHLDLASKEVLLDALRGYQGTLVFVSHDRYFVDALATRVVEVGGGRIESYFGNYEDFLRVKASRGESGHSALRVESSAGATAEAPPLLDKEDRRRQHEDRKEAQRGEKKRLKELSEVEARIETKEAEQTALEQTMADPELYRDPLAWREVSLRHEALREEIAGLYAIWETLQVQLTASIVGGRLGRPAPDAGKPGRGMPRPYGDLMDQAFPFVIAVASEKGGVGKTTIATNLAVYLKALREDLPVTIASFDNHFSVDQMFAIGSHTGASVAGLFSATPAAELARLGEYGVQFLASDRSLSPPDDDPFHLRNALARSGLSGIFILDTRPILDYFTRNALIAADLVLVPVKDRASLVNAGSLRQAIEKAGEQPEKMWLVPSLIDARLRLRQEIGVREFLVFSAQERGYQVVDTFISKSPKVEGLATSFTSRIHPVITHAKGTIVHSQLRELAGFALQHYDATDLPLCRSRALAPDEEGSSRLVIECPACGRRAPAGTAGYAFQDLRSRRHGRLHPDCLQGLVYSIGLETFLSAEGMLVFAVEGAGFAGPEADLILRLCDGEGEVIVTEHCGDPAGTPFEPFLKGATGRTLNELAREFLFVLLETGIPEDEEENRFAALRRRVLREVLGKVKF